MSRFRVSFDKATHEYKFHENGRSWVVPSVTSVISDAGLIKGKEFMRESDRRRGHEVHDSIAAFYDGEEAPTEHKGYVRSFNLWQQVMNCKPIYLEKVVYSKTFGYVGRLDWLGWMNGVLVLIDFKTSASIQGWVALQLSAYAQAYQEMLSRGIFTKKELGVRDYGLPFLYSLQLSKTGEMPKLRRWEYNFSGFQECLQKAKVSA